MAGDDRADGPAVRDDAQGLLPAGRYRPDLRLDRGLARHLLPRDGAAAAAGRRTSSSTIPAVAGVGLVHRRRRRRSVNQGRLFISLKPGRASGRPSHAGRRRGCASKLSHVPGIRVFMVPVQDLRAGGAAGQVAIPVHPVGPGFRRARRLAAQGAGRGCASCRASSTSSTDREQGGLQANVVIDRAGGGAARRRDPGDRQRARATPSASGRSRPSTRSATSTGSCSRSRRARQRDPSDIIDIYVPGTGGTQVPLVGRRARRARHGRRSSSTTRAPSRR